MKTEDLYKKVQELIEGGQPAPEAFTELLDFVRDEEGDSKFLKALRKLDSNKEQQRLKKWLGAALEKEPPEDDIVAFWFGLFNTGDASGPTSVELYIAGSTEQPGEDPDWAVDPEYWPERRYSKSRLLEKIYRHAYASGGPETEGEYFCLWYSALAVAELCRELGPLMLGQSVGQEGGFVVLNVLACHECLDMERSDYFAYEDDHELAGQTISLYSAVLDPKRLPESNIFRLKEDDSCVIVSREVKQLLEDEKISGIKFEPLSVGQ